MNNLLPIYNITLESDKAGIYAVSLVDQPAVDSLFMSFDKDAVQVLLKADDEQHIVYGCILRADYPIYRDNSTYGQHYIMFGKDVIKTLAEKFMKEQKGQSVDINHDFNYIDGVYLTQLFIKDSANGINPTGFEDIADGSLFGTYKIEDESVWNDVKAGKLNGFSIEGLLTQEIMMSKQAEQDVDEDELESFLNEILK